MAALSLVFLSLLGLSTEGFLLKPPGGGWVQQLQLSKQHQRTHRPLRSHSIEVLDSGPAGSKVHRLTLDLGTGGDPIVIETGRIGRQAAGAVTLTRGSTVLYSTAARDDLPKAELDFLPLSVEYQERFSSAGTTSGGYTKRDGRAAEHEILTCRLIDRPIRPLIADGWRHETQLLTWVLSYDGERSCDPLAIVSSAAALYISDIPLTKPIAGAEVGLIDGEFVFNPTNEQMENSTLHLTVAGTKDAVLMIEGAADFLPEDKMIEAIKFGHGYIKQICDAIQELGEAIGVQKNLSTIRPPVEGLQDKVDKLFTDRIDTMYQMKDNKAAMGSVMTELYASVEELEEDFPGEKLAIKAAFKDLLCRRMFVRAKENGLRCDGRELKEIRTIDVEAGILPSVHGSALFTRGETQAIATATLGDSGMKQKIDKIDGTEEKRFYLQYTFPPSCVGETGRIGAPGRREVGHGNLAERALIPTLPEEQDFPYSIRVESLITESHGSSSMASVCGGCLALMDAGVPLKRPVAGIAMGMLLGDKGGVSDENAVILSDILGTEDALGTMDFKVAGDKDGITTFQLDIKCEGLSFETMEIALAQAKEGRLHILNQMGKVLAEPRDTLPSTVPKILSFSIEPGSVGKIIGPAGKQIRAIIEDFKLENMDVGSDNGEIQMTSFNQTQLEEAKEFVISMAAGSAAGKGGGGAKNGIYAGPMPVEGQIYEGKITGIHSFGCFVEILPGAEDGSTRGLEGLCHVSELAVERVPSTDEFIAGLGTDVLRVMYVGKKKNGKLSLSRRKALEAEVNGKSEVTGESKPDAAAPVAAVVSTATTPEMTSDEIDIIAQAIEDLNEELNNV